MLFVKVEFDMVASPRTSIAPPEIPTLPIKSVKLISSVEPVSA